MRFLFYISFLLFPIFATSQNEELKKDSTSLSNFYIKDYSNQLNIKIDANNSQTRYFIPYENNKAEIRTNLNVSYGLVFSYKFLSVRLGIRPKLSDSDIANKGETDFYRLGVKLLFDRWTHRLEYNYRRGFFLENTNEFKNNIVDPEFKIQLQKMTSNIFSGSSIYRFNKNYSVKAIESNTEIQLKRAGTFLLGLNYSLYFLNGIDEVTLEDRVFLRDTYNEYSGFSPVFIVGYDYTYIIHKYWYINAFCNPGVGIDFYMNDSYANNVSKSENGIAVFLSAKTGVSAGYNGDKIYFGGGFGYDVNTEKYVNDDVVFQPVDQSFNVFLGYRFRAPEQVRKPVNYIEKQVPVIKKEND